MELCRISYLIMGILRSQNAIDRIHGLTVYEIHKLGKVTVPNTVHKKIKNLEKLGFVKEGVKSGKAKTYFLTEEGQKQLPEKKENLQ